MRIQHQPKGRARLWHHTEPGFAALGVWTERIPGSGEDADPLMLFQRSRSRGILAVFDGAGGAGRSSAGRTPAGTDHSQAWVASRRVRGIVEEWFIGSSPVPAREPVPLRERIAARIAIDGVPASRIRGSMHRLFPTTVAGLDFWLSHGDVAWNVVWAGDSRCYVAESRDGLQQLSLDDTDQDDALELLVQDPPMINLVSADRAFTLHNVAGRASLPCLLVCATDGFFGYVQTPAQFEHMLLDTLMSAQDARHWSALLAQRVEACTGDDASLALVALGFPDFEALRARFRRRAAFVDVEYAEPMRDLPSDDTVALVAAREKSWLRYRSAYEQRLDRSHEVTR